MIFKFPKDFKKASLVCHTGGLLLAYSWMFAAKPPKYLLTNVESALIIEVAAQMSVGDLLGNSYTV